MKPTLAVVCAFVLWLPPASRALAGLAFSDIGLSSIVDNGFTGLDDDDGGFITESPASGSFLASLGLSSAETIFDFEWDALSADFLIEASHAAEDVPASTLFVRSGGGFIFSSSQDIDLAIDAHYSFNAPAPGFYARTLVQLIDLADDSVVFFDLDDGGPWALGPPVDTLSIDGNVLAPAGSTYLLGYEMRLQTFASGTDVIAMGDGTIHFTLQVIPESGTLSMLALAALLAVRRRPRRR